MFSINSVITALSIFDCIGRLPKSRSLELAAQN
jgi:hypothetical protein